MSSPRLERAAQVQFPRSTSALRIRRISSASEQVIHPKSITILYCHFTLFIDIFHFKVFFLCCFGLFYTVYNFPVPKQQNQDSAVKKSGYQVAESDQVQMRSNFRGSIFMEDDWESPKEE